MERLRKFCKCFRYAAELPLSTSTHLPQQQPPWTFPTTPFILSRIIYRSHPHRHRQFSCFHFQNFLAKSTICLVFTLGFVSLLAYFIMTLFSHVLVNNRSTSHYNYPQNHATPEVSFLAYISPTGYPFHDMSVGSHNNANNNVTIQQINNDGKNTEREATNKATNKTVVKDKNAKDEKVGTHRTRNKNEKSKKGKFWMRISDEVFIYSAHLDTRNFSTHSPPSRNNSSSKGEKNAAFLTEEKKGFDESTKRGRGGGDSDKLNPVILVRIVGMKTVPPLREFLEKGDVLEWFRLKHEMEFSHKYECKLFFSSFHGRGQQYSSKLLSLSATRITYTVIEEGIKVYAGCYFNCYFEINLSSPSVLDSIRLSITMDNLQVAMYPRQIADYPTKLIDVSTLMAQDYNRDRNFDFQNENNKIYYFRKSLAVCVRPLFGPFDDLPKLIQFISYYHVMGITQFNFYSLAISPSIRKYLMKLSEATTGTWTQTFPGFVLHDWNLPTGNTSELWDYGTLAALNDCLFSNINHEFVVFVDVDEFIVPQKRSHDGDVTGLWNIIDSYNASGTYQYLIRNTFFCHEFCKNEAERNDMNLSQLPPLLHESNASLTERNLLLPIFKCHQRTKRIWHPALRTKFIINPRQVLAVGHHLATKYINKKTDFRFTPGFSVQVDPAVAIMNHYRECASISSKEHPILSRVREEDKTMLRYQEKVFRYIESYYRPELVIGEDAIK